MTKTQCRRIIHDIITTRIWLLLLILYVSLVGAMVLFADNNNDNQDKLLLPLLFASSSPETIRLDTEPSWVDPLNPIIADFDFV